MSRVYRLSNADLAGRFLALCGRPDITERILDELALTQTWVLQVLQQDRLLERKQVLGSAIALRSPYVDALSELQLAALTKVRAGDGEQWRRLLLLTVNGLAAGAATIVAALRNPWASPSNRMSAWGMPPRRAWPCLWSRVAGHGARLWCWRRVAAPTPG